ncbi:type IV pilin [Halovenus sp. WSH3]|uniref:Type IV pilin n=1 Tax=Halovenus carboxidivorans TaxID=2692199 RepID=A0A6B0TB75_9EURY|nr:type IV pilin [Halovenus carboxidivorans]
MLGGTDDDATVEFERAISAVLGVTLMVAIVVLLASVVAGFVLTYDDQLREPEFDNATDGSINPWSNTDALLAPRDPTAGAENVRYRVRIEIKDANMEGDSLNELDVSVTTSDDMFSGTSASDIESFEVEKTDGTTLDIESDVDGWVVSDGGSSLQIQLSGSEYTNPSTGDVITVVFDGVANPNDPDTYDVTVVLNEGEDEQSGELEILARTESIRARPAERAGLVAAH